MKLLLLGAFGLSWLMLINVFCRSLAIARRSCCPCWDRGSTGGADPGQVRCDDDVSGRGGCCSVVREAFVPGNDEESMMNSVVSSG